MSKPTRTECFKAAAPYLARLALLGRRAERQAQQSSAQSSDAHASPSDPRAA